MDSVFCYAIVNYNFIGPGGIYYEIVESELRQTESFRGPRTVCPDLYEQLRITYNHLKSLEQHICNSRRRSTSGNQSSDLEQQSIDNSDISQTPEDSHETQTPNENETTNNTDLTYTQPRNILNDRQMAELDELNRNMASIMNDSDDRPESDHSEPVSQDTDSENLDAGERTLGESERVDNDLDEVKNDYDESLRNILRQVLSILNSTSLPLDSGEHSQATILSHNSQVDLSSSISTNALDSLEGFQSVPNHEQEEREQEEDENNKNITVTDRHELTGNLAESEQEENQEDREDEIDEQRQREEHNTQIIANNEDSELYIESQISHNDIESSDQYSTTDSSFV